MTTTHKISTATRTRAAAAALLFAAGAVVASAAGAVGVAAPANASGDLYIYLAVGNGFDYKTGMAINANQELARVNALTNCANAGGGNCVNYVMAKNGCAAVAVQGTAAEYVGATGDLLYMAQRTALRMNPGGHIAVSGCTTQPPRSVARASASGPSQ
jgi:hypothetical protein